jgi:nicotinate dehydrogenase subunit B
MTSPTVPVERIDSWLDVDDAGIVWIRTGKVELGQGIHEALAILVADELDLDLAHVRVAPVDTEMSRDEGQTAGSRSIEESGTALRMAAASLRAMLLEAAATHFREPGGGLRM